MHDVNGMSNSPSGADRWCSLAYRDSRPRKIRYVEMNEPKNSASDDEEHPDSELGVQSPVLVAWWSCEPSMP